MLSVLGQIVSEMRPLSKYKIETLNSDLNFSIPDDVPENMIYLPEYNKRVYSQNGEDGITMAIFDKIGFTNKKYLEFGATNECNNSQILHEKYGFSGILWNGSNTFCTYSNIFQEFINVENIKELCIKYNVPSEPDFVSIDIDGNDWHVWRELNKICRPRVLVIEYSGHFCPGNDNVMPYNANHVWDGSNYHGGSIEAMYILGRSIGYSLVCADNMGVNLFFIRDDIEPKKFFFGTNNVKMLYRLPKYGLPYRVGHPEDFLKRPWHSAKNLVYTFSETWFYGSELFHFLNQGFLKPIKILEIGSYEGCSAVHFSDNFLELELFHRLIHHLQSKFLNL